VTPHIHTREDEYSIAIGFDREIAKPFKSSARLASRTSSATSPILSTRVPRRCKTLLLSLAITACSSVILPGYLI
jgi:hypothetical protein